MFCILELDNLTRPRGNEIDGSRMLRKAKSTSPAVKYMCSQDGGFSHFPEP